MKSVAELSSASPAPVILRTEAVDNEPSRASQPSSPPPRARWLKKSLRIATVCLLTYWLAIFVGTHLPGSSVPDLYLSDKILHFLAYSGLAFLVSWAVPVFKGRMPLHLLVTFIIVVGYGCIDEFTQSFIPGRQASGWDLLADALGAVTGIIAYLFCRKMLVRFPLGQRLIHALGR